LPNLDLGSYVVLTNAKYIKFTGNKLDREYYYNHSGYPGGLRERSTRIMSEKYPKELVFRIIKGMIPHTKLGRRQLKRLFVYSEDKHNLQAQEKQFIKINL
jgi:large subunit ribosomal protein L13